MSERIVVHSESPTHRLRALEPAPCMDEPGADCGCVSMSAGFVGALEGAGELDPMLDEMRDVARRIRNGATAVQGAVRGGAAREPVTPSRWTNVCSAGLPTGARDGLTSP